MTELKRVNVRLRPALYELLKKHADERGLTMNAMYILALETYIQQLMVTESMPDLLKAWESGKHEI